MSVDDNNGSAMQNATAVATLQSSAVQSAAAASAMVPFEWCLQAEASVLDPFYNAVKAVQTALSVAILLLLAKLLADCWRDPPPLHLNLMMLLANALFLYALYALSYLCIHLRSWVQMLTYASPCDCLTAPWLASLLRMPCFVYLDTSPMLHFAITVERLRASVLAKGYEREGQRCGIASLAVVWTLSLVFNAYVLLNAFADTEQFGRPLMFVMLTTRYNQEAIVNVHYVFLVLIICITVADYFLIRYNRAIHRNRLCYWLALLTVAAVVRSCTGSATADCGPGETRFGDCLLDGTCPSISCPGCHCTGNSCCYPSSATQNSFWQRLSAAANGQQQSGTGDGTGAPDLVNTILALLLLIRQQQAGGQCQDRAWNCGQFAPLCLSVSRMLAFCPVTCGLCPGPLLTQQLLLQLLLGQQQTGGGLQTLNTVAIGNNIPNNNFAGRVQGWLEQVPSLASSFNTALGALGGTGLNIQALGQQLGGLLG